MLNVVLKQGKNEGVWGDNALIGYGESEATIFFEGDYPSRRIQQAGRQLQSQGVSAVALEGEGWSYERQWAFYCGYAPTRGDVTLKWASTDEDELELLNARRHAHDWARRMINATPEEMYPESLAQEAVDFLTGLAGDNISVDVIKGEALAEQGWVGVWNVGRASVRPPVMLTIDYNPSGDADAPVAACLVGKGITFDSGGYSIKTSAGMVAMKCDMGGAATVTAALGYAIAQGLNKRVKLILCCAENLIAGNAYKLGDVLTYKNGVSVEILNTDAEGRLVLADGLLAASETNAPLIIDAATLTGAAMMAVGEDYNALFSLDAELLMRSQQLSNLVNEPAWPLPLEKWHQQQCPSPYADTANSRPVKGGGMGGASNAAGFLSRFVREDGKGWLHVDLAGCFRDSGGARWAAGATGLGIAHIAALLIA
ncbi:aminopeptidase PepB [Thaumasiovibrio subtropicus]|uniref:aminopeptidase PepB n=1 Tax=Thaumasiovibrio subtropicus TaxID=1891207 RepID=UPI000B3502A1|nr:aminopeptidase PepB [Thaumasiovibrio subtropicus]